MQVGYARVSTSRDQAHDLQIDALNRAGCERVFTETASGTRTDRPQLAEALNFMREGDVLVVWRLDRLARSTKHLIELADELQRRGIGLRSLNESIDTTTATGKFMFTVMGALAAMEAELIRERTRAGLAAARARGRRGGRPRALDATKLHVAKALIAEGRMTMSEIAEHVGCGASTLYRSLARHAPKVSEAAVA